MSVDLSGESRPSVHVGSERRLNHQLQPAPMTGSGRRMNMSGRRVNFEAAHANGQSARRAPGSSRRVNQSVDTQGGNLQGLSESQQSATQSAVSVSHLFSEARREIRRGVQHEKEKIERLRDSLHRTPDTTVPAPADEEDEEQPEELTLKTDVTAMYEMLMGDKVLASMLLCIPLGILAYFTNFGGDSATFIFNFIAIIPLAWLLGNATEELAMYSSQTVGGLLNATFGNVRRQTRQARRWFFLWLGVRLTHVCASLFASSPPRPGRRVDRLRDRAPQGHDQAGPDFVARFDPV